MLAYLHRSKHLWSLKRCKEASIYLCAVRSCLLAFLPLFAVLASISCYANKGEIKGSKANKHQQEIEGKIED
jgi:hypothetical protein